MQKQIKSLEVVVLAAGEGTRMRSKVPKVLHEVGGTSLVQHVLNAALTLEPSNIHVVVGHRGRDVQESLSDYNVQKESTLTNVGSV